MRRPRRLRRSMASYLDDLVPLDASLAWPRVPRQPTAGLQKWAAALFAAAALVVTFAGPRASAPEHRANVGPSKAVARLRPALPRLRARPPVIRSATARPRIKRKRGSHHSLAGRDGSRSATAPPTRAGRAATPP